MLAQEYNVESPLYDSAAFIPANYNYLNLELSSEKLPNQSPQSFILPFLDHSPNIGQLIQGLIQRTNLQPKYPFQNLRVYLKEGNRVKMDCKLDELRIKLCRESASGVTLRVKAVFNKLQDQAAQNFYIYNQSDFNHGKINKWFLLLNNQEPFCISIPKNIPSHKLESAICDCLNQSYKNSLSPLHLSFYAIEKEEKKEKENENGNENEDQKDKEKQNEEEKKNEKEKKAVGLTWRKTRQLDVKEVCSLILEAQHRMVGVQSVKEGAIWPVSEVESEQYLIFHIRNNYKLKLRFSLIAKYTISELLQHLQIEHINNNLGIKIVDQIFAPCRVLKDAERYFRTGDGQFAKNVECRLVSEREMFYSSIGTMNGDFNLPKEMVTVDKEKMYDQCRDLAQRKIQEDREKSDQPLFKTVDQIHPITLYTSSINVIDQQTASAPLLYRALNDFLRIQKFGLKLNHQGEWRYQFSARLIKSLEKIRPFDRVNPETNRVTVYRGIRGHQLEGETGQLYVAKQFLSTSISKEKATNFTKHSPIGTILQIQCLSGREISQYSKYQKEQEVLFMPYTYFRIAEKDTSSPVFKMKLVELEQKHHRSNPATYILWVDDKLKEGEKVISSLNCPMHTTFLHQLRSTKALQQWIEHNQYIVRNKEVKIAVISNMRRRQDEKQVLDAGAKTVLLVRERFPHSDIVLYIWNVQGTKAQLAANNIDPNSVKIFTKRAELRPFIAVCCAPLVQEEEKEGDDLVFQTISSVLKKTNLSHTSSKVSSKSQESSP